MKIIPECLQMLGSSLMDVTLIFSTDEEFCRAYRTNSIILPEPTVIEEYLKFWTDSEKLREITLLEGIYGQIELKLDTHEKTRYAVAAYTMEGQFLGYLEDKPSLQFIAALNANEPMYIMVRAVKSTYFQDYYFEVYVTNEASFYQQKFDQLLSHANSALAQILKDQPKIKGFYKIVGEKFGEWKTDLSQLKGGELVYLERHPYK